MRETGKAWEPHLHVNARVGKAPNSAGCEAHGRSSRRIGSRRCRPWQIVYDKLGRHSDAEAMLEKLRASDGDAASLRYTAIFAQWGLANRALDSLERAKRLRTPDLEQLKAFALYDPIRNEPRFQAVMRELRFPD